MFIASVIHPDLPESKEVFLERISLFPEGCLGLVSSENGELCGYAISHPIRQGQPPVLDSLLGEIAPNADQYYIHDVAILPEFRGHKLAHHCILRILLVAQRYPSASLVSVYNTVNFWGRYGFVQQDVNKVLANKLIQYGHDARYLERMNSGLLS